MDGYDDSAPNFDSLFSAAENRSYSSVQYSATVNKSVGIILTLILNKLGLNWAKLNSNWNWGLL